MSRKLPKPIAYAELESIELVWLAQCEDRSPPGELHIGPADTELLSRKMDVIKRLVRKCVHKYSFVDPDDLQQSLVIAFFKVVRAYRPGRANGWDKYCNLRLPNCIKDILRQRDDLGIKWPQKKHYPEWFHLYDKSDSDDAGHVYANTLSDHRSLSEDVAEELEWRSWFDEVRASLSSARCPCNRQPAKPSTHDQHPVAWSQIETTSIAGKYYWLPLPEGKKRKRVSLTLLQWRRERVKPKQMEMWA